MNEQKKHKLGAATVEFGNEFGDFNAAKHFETPANHKEKTKQKNQHKNKKA